MKFRITLALAATGVAAMLTFSNCKKEQNVTPAEGFVNSENTSNLTTDRIDAIMKDLSTDSYSLSFDRPILSAGITRTAYGADNYLVFADPQDLICPDPIKFRQRLVPIWKIPVIVQPTCPDMSIDIYKLEQVRELLVKAAPLKYGKLQEIKLSNGGGLLATGKFTNQYANLKTDKIDAITKDLSSEKYLLFNAPGNFDGVFTRSFYGYADLNKIVFEPYRTNLKDILKPTLKGCFDPLVLSIIRDRLQRIDPALYKDLNVTTLPQDKSIGLLTQN
jgi:hypothetical protein